MHRQIQSSYVDGGSISLILGVTDRSHPTVYIVAPASDVLRILYVLYLFPLGGVSVYNENES